MSGRLQPLPSAVCVVGRARSPGKGPGVLSSYACCGTVPPRIRTYTWLVTWIHVLSSLPAPPVSSLLVLVNKGFTSNDRGWGMA